MNWWWQGVIGAARKHQVRQSDPAATAEQPFQSVALVVGSTGIVGTSLVSILPQPDTPGGPWKVYALSRRPPPIWSQQASSSVSHLHVDLTDAAAVAEALTLLTDITHVFYVAYSPHITEEENRETNPAMLRNVLSVVVPNCPSLVHVCLQTGTKHYMGSPEAMMDGSTAVLERPYTEDMPRLTPWPNFYYDQEDVLFDAVAKRDGGSVSWSVHRPSLILGLSPRSALNIMCCLCVYAAICHKEGTVLRWPGSLDSWEGFRNASDADLIAEQQIWAAVDPMAKNEPFNCNNGDIYKWKHLWPILAQRFGLKWAGYEGEESRVSLAVTMAGKEAVWEEIVKENQLVATQLHEVANWWFVDALFGMDLQFLDSMNKSKKHGFLGFRNTSKSFNTWIDRMMAHKIVPSCPGLNFRSLL